MPVTYTPDKANADFDQFSGVATDDPKNFTAHRNKRVAAKYVLNPVQNELLKIIYKMQFLPVAKTGTFNMTGGNASNAWTIFTNVGASGAASARPINLQQIAISSAPYNSGPFGFFDHDGDGIQVVAHANDYIQCGGNKSAQGGNIASDFTGAFFFLFAISSDTWGVFGATDLLVDGA